MKISLLILSFLICQLGLTHGQFYDVELDMSDPGLWTVDVVHLGTKQIEISYDSKNDAVVMLPTWSKKDRKSKDVGISNIENGRLHSYQHIKLSDCTQSEVHFEINMPQAYIDEGKMEFVFSLQAGAAGDYLFNGFTFSMENFKGSGGTYKKMIVVPADYNEDLVKLRKIERVNIIFERNASFVSAPIKIRNLRIHLNEDKIIPPAADVQVTNPNSFYEFTYRTQAAVDALEVRVSNESMAISRELSRNGDGVALIPQWREEQVPQGHTGDVILVQSLGSPHNFESFEIEYLFELPQAYQDEDKIEFKPFIQAGEQGYYVWSGITRDLSSLEVLADQNVIVRLSTEDFLVNKQKKKNLIELIGFGINRNGSNLCEPIILKNITIRLPEVNGVSEDLQPPLSELTAQSFIQRFPDPDTMYCCGNTNHFSWQAGYVMFAMEKIWKSTGDSIYYKYIKRYVDQQVDEFGNIPDFKDDALDNFLPGYAILFMYEQTGEEKYKIAAEIIRRGFDDYPRNSDGLFWHGEWATNQSWIDGVFMGQVFLARYGSLMGDSKYTFKEVVSQMTLMAKRCGKDNGLILHGWDESKKASWADKTTGLAPEVWSEGLGWYAVLIAEVFDYLPEDQAGYKDLLTIHKRLCEGLKNNQDPETGMWCQVVDKCGEAGNWNETSGTGMYIYLLQKSIDGGFISENTYNPVIKKAYAGMIKKARYNSEGFIDLLDCSSIGIVDNYDAYINSPKEVSPFGAFGSFIISTNILEHSGE